MNWGFKDKKLLVIIDFLLKTSSWFWFFFFFGMCFCFNENTKNNLILCFLRIA